PWRGGTRVPSFWRWPGTLPAGVDVPAVTAHIDVLPTLCELSGVQVPPAVAAKVEGRSLVPLLRDARAAWPDRPLVTHVGRWERGQAAASGLLNCRIREGRWSLVNTQNSPDAWELYDIAADRGECHDVAADHPDVVGRLSDTFNAWWAGVQPDLVNEDQDGPAENPFKAAFRAQFGPECHGGAADRPNFVVILIDDLGYGDNGPWIGWVKDVTSAGPLRGSKGSTWEGGVRVPTIARWPGLDRKGPAGRPVAWSIRPRSTL
ncbi:MAG: sulfatase/phosphatase domain-containing protein, partial [Planctomycetaceae bacterium]